MSEKGWWQIAPGVFFGGTREQYLKLKGVTMISGRACMSGSLTVEKQGPLMKCGHVADGYRDGDPNKPCCTICEPPEAYEVAETPKPDDIASREDKK